MEVGTCKLRLLHLTRSFSLRAILPLSAHTHPRMSPNENLAIATRFLKIPDLALAPLGGRLVDLSCPRKTSTFESLDPLGERSS